MTRAGGTESQWRGFPQRDDRLLKCRGRGNGHSGDMSKRGRYEHMAELLFPKLPRVGLKLAERRAPSLLRVRSGGHKARPIPTVEEFIELLGPMPAVEARAIRARCAVTHARTTLIKQSVEERGLQSLTPLVEAKGLEILERVQQSGRGVLVTSWHSGPESGVWALLSDRGIALLRVQNTAWLRPPENWEIVRRVYEPGEGLRVLKRCQSRLKKSGWVGFSFDNHTGGENMATIPFLGRAVPYPLGIGVLSQRTNSPILPIFTHWAERGLRIVLDIQEPLEPETYASRFGDQAELEMIRELVRRTEIHARAFPWELNGRRVRQLLGFPLEAA